MYGLIWNILFAWLIAGRVIWNNSGSALAAASTRAAKLRRRKLKVLRRCK